MVATAALATLYLLYSSKRKQISRKLYLLINSELGLEEQKNNPEKTAEVSQTEEEVRFWTDR